jgi:hypothetical protein
MAKKYTDTELIDFLERQNKKNRYTGFCMFRISTTNRGWRLHETEAAGSKSNVRSAIIDAIEKENLECLNN